MKIKTKQSKTDFQTEKLPHTRTQVFWDVLKINWRTFFVLAFVLFAGFVPMLLCLFFRDNYALGLSVRMSRGEISKEAALSLYKYAHLICAGACWVSFYFLAVAICFATRFIRQMIWYEPIFVKEDLAKALKNGYGSAAICATFAGIILVVSKLMLFISNNAIVQIIPAAIFIPFISMPLLLTYVQSTIYLGKFSQLLKNSIALYIKEALKVLLFGLLLLLPILFALMDQFLMVKYIVLSAYLLVFENLFILMFYLVCNHIFDKYINREQFPEIYKKGLYIEPESMK